MSEISLSSRSGAARGGPATPVRIGLVSAGELGTAIGKLLRAGGYDVFVSLEDRSDGTVARARTSGFRELPELSSLLGSVDVLLSVVPPGQAGAVARQVADARGRRDRELLYVDMNSIAPATVRRVADLVCYPETVFADAVVVGLADRLSSQGTLFVSGPGAHRVGALFSAGLRVVDLGPEIGRASLFKMLIGGFNKGLAALAMETGAAANRGGLLEAFVGECRRYYPGVLTVLDRLLPTYPAHAARRVDELGEAEATFRSLGVDAGIMGAARRRIALMDPTCSPAGDPSPGGAGAESLIGLLRQLDSSAFRLLESATAPGSASTTQSSKEVL